MKVVTPDAVLLHLITAMTLAAYKIAILIPGYLIIRLGYTLFMKGVSGEFQFSAEFKGIKTHLISASPGVFLILMGTIVVSVGLYKGLEFETASTNNVDCTTYEEGQSQSFTEEKPLLSESPPEKDAQ